MRKYARKSVDARFWSHVRKSPGCWLWQSGCSTKGYGHFWANDAGHRAHRFSYEMAYGPIPEGMQVLHKCDTPACVRPSHLFLGTNLINMRDKCRKGRHRCGRVKGDKHGAAKLTARQVRAIRKDREKNGTPYKKLAARYGVSDSAICDICTRKKWKHVA